MPKLRIKPLPHDESTGAVSFEDTTAATQGRRTRDRGDPAALLGEAIRFYNYGLEAHHAGLGPTGYQVHKDREQWTAMSTGVMQSAMWELCLALRDSLNDSLEALTQTETLGRHLTAAAIKQFPLGYSSNRALLAVHLFLNDTYRDKRQAGKPGWRVREFEHLVGRLNALRDLIRRDVIEQEIAKHYRSRLLPGADPASHFFTPHWGGRWYIRPAETFRYPQRPFYPHDAREVGATEKLYIGVVSTVFTPGPLLVNHGPRGGLLTDLGFLSDVYEQAAAVEQVLPDISGMRAPNSEWRRLKRGSGDVPDTRGYAERTAVWSEWLDNLRILEHLFSLAIDTRESHLAVERYPGVIIGLPAALGLIGVLRAYLADLMGRALMVALSLSIRDIYTWINGYGAVALWEALSGEDAEGALAKGCLSWFEDQGAPAGGSPLRGKLARWRELPVPAHDFWGSSEPVHEAARNTLSKLLTRPLYGPGIQRPPHAHAVKHLADPVTFLRFKDYLRRYPPLRSSLGIARVPDHDWMFGARFAAQAHLFVAHQINAQAAKRLWIDWESKHRYRMPPAPKPPPRDPKTKKQPFHRKKPRWDNFRLTAGSYGWAGRKPPHVTHIEGVNFDIVFGPDIIPFAKATGLGEALSHCDAAQRKKSKEQQQRYTRAKRVIADYAKSRGVQSYFLKTPVVACYTPAQVRLAQEGLFRPMVYRQLLTRRISELRGELFTRFYDKTLAGEEITLDDETFWYQRIEGELSGTPHFMDTDEAISALMSPHYATELPDWQRTHAGHVAIMLSAPRAMVFASPIAHFRAMRAIRSVFYDKDPELFQSATRLIKQVYFDFKPHDHHNHWHVNYHQDDAMRHLEKNFTLWMSLGVDMNPFVKYLHEYRITGIVSPALRKALEAERVQVLQVCQEYERTRARYVEDKGDDAAETLLDELFWHFTSEGGLADPTITARAADQIGRSGMLADSYAVTRGVVEQFVSLLKNHDCDTRGIYEASLWDGEALEEALTPEEGFEVDEDE